MDISEEKHKDPEVGVDASTPDEAPLPPYSKHDGIIHEGTLEGQAELSFWTRMGCTAESFKRRSLADKHNQLNQTLRSRHLHMIAIGGSIGTGLFVGSGSALGTGGPAALVIAFLIIGFVCSSFFRSLFFGFSRPSQFRFPPAAASSCKTWARLTPAAFVAV